MLTATKAWIHRLFHIFDVLVRNEIAVVSIFMEARALNVFVFWKRLWRWLLVECRPLVGMNLVRTHPVRTLLGRGSKITGLQSARPSRLRVRRSHICICFTFVDIAFLKMSWHRVQLPLLSMRRFVNRILRLLKIDMVYRLPRGILKFFWTKIQEMVVLFIFKDHNLWSMKIILNIHSLMKY